MNDRVGDRAANAAPQRQFWSTRPQRRAPASAPARSRDTNRADAGERRAQAAIGLDEEEREVQRARPRLPLRHNIGAVTGAIEREREAGIAVLGHDRNGAGVSFAA